MNITIYMWGKKSIDFEEEKRGKKATKMCFYLLQGQFAIAFIMVPFQSSSLSCGDLIMNHLASFILMFV